MMTRKALVIFIAAFSILLMGRFVMADDAQVLPKGIFKGSLDACTGNFSASALCTCGLGSFGTIPWNKSSGCERNVSIASEKQFESCSVLKINTSKYSLRWNSSFAVSLLVSTIDCTASFGIFVFSRAR